MKKQTVLSLLSLCLLLMGCLREDMSGCETIEGEGLVIHFAYTNEKGVDEFASRVDQVDLYVFDEGGYYLSNHSYNARKLSEFQGSDNLNLEPGTYHIICWGNVYGNDILPQLTEDMMVHSARISYTETAVGGDSLYYAPRKTSTSLNDFPLYEITVPEKGKEEVTLEFMTTYYALNVYVKGLKDYIGSYNQNPYIEVKGLPESYDFHLRLGEYNRNFTRISQTVTVEGQNYAHSSFLTRYIERENPVEICVIRSTTQEVVHSVNLQEILQASNYVLKIGVYADINVYIEFLPDGSVEVSLKITGWNNTGVSPGI
ncbi:MAG: FimB/Mfa2 family fimbrial subunit [Tannerellaceae bacterium]|nr:FimB/Mfa2 family fimbrial subunit [Tannerellaceae bacterium]